MRNLSLRVLKRCRKQISGRVEGVEGMRDQGPDCFAHAKHNAGPGVREKPRGQHLRGFETPQGGGGEMKRAGNVGNL